MNRVAISFTNFGPYHLARLRALALELATPGGPAHRLRGGRDRATLSLADRPGATSRSQWVTLFPDRVLETIPPPACARAMRRTPSTATAPTRWRSSATPGPSRWPRSAGRGGRGGRRS